MGLRILVVDDNRDSVTALSLLLKLDGHSVRFATTVDQALAITDHDLQCVVFDLQMPGKDAVGLARELRRRHGDRICLICMTELRIDHPEVTELMEFANHALPKPVDVGWLRDLLPSFDQPDTMY